MNRRLYAIHRWISALAFVQLAIWSVSGAFFAIAPTTRVRGRPVAHELPIPVAAPILAPRDALERAAGSGLAGPSALELRAMPAGLFYVVRGAGRAVRLDAGTGTDAPVSRAEAEETARRDQPDRPAVLASTLITSDAHVEYRGKPLPAWRVALADGVGTVVYVDAVIGDVTARRNDLWRAYDFLWSLHIMDYGARDNVNHPLLVAAGLLAIFTVGSGAVLWAIRLARWSRLRWGSGQKTNPSPHE